MTHPSILKVLAAVLTTAILISLSPTAQAQDHDIPSGVVGCGGGRMQGENHLVIGTAGQAAIGIADDATWRHEAGFWYLPGVVPTAAYLTDFMVERSGGRADLRATVRWQVSGASAGDAFHVWRQEPGQERQRLTVEPLAGIEHFEYVDAAAPAGEVAYWLSRQTGDGGDVTWYGPVRLSAAPLIFHLEPNHPNPFNPSTAIRFSLPEPGPVRLVIHDARGKVVRTLLDQIQPAGIVTVVWDGRDSRGGDVASGVYLARLQSVSGIETSKMLLAR